jgi:hypothetical protein
MNTFIEIKCHTCIAAAVTIRTMLHAVLSIVSRSFKQSALDIELLPIFCATARTIVSNFEDWEAFNVNTWTLFEEPEQANNWHRGFDSLVVVTLGLLKTSSEVAATGGGIFADLRALVEVFFSCIYLYA